MNSKRKRRTKTIKQENKWKITKGSEFVFGNTVKSWDWTESPSSCLNTVVQYMCCHLSSHSLETIVSLCSELHTQHIIDISVDFWPPSWRATLRPVNKVYLPGENKCTFMLNTPEPGLKQGKHREEEAMEQSLVGHRYRNNVGKSLIKNSKNYCAPCNLNRFIDGLILYGCSFFLILVGCCKKGWVLL